MTARLQALQSVHYKQKISEDQSNLCHQCAITCYTAPLTSVF